MADRNVSVEEVTQTVVAYDKSYVGRFGRFVAEKDFGTRILRVIYNKGQDEAVIITAVPIRKIGGDR